MPQTINYVTQYQQALIQNYPYVLHFGALYATPNNGRFRWTGARTIEIPSITTTGRVDSSRDTIQTAQRNYDNSWEPKTLTNQRIDGSFVGLWPFAVYVRTSAVDTSKHLEAAGHLSSLNAWLRSTLLPELSGSQTASSFEMTSLPAIAGVYEDGNVDYQAVFQLKYHQRSE